MSAELQVWHNPQKAASVIRGRLRGRSRKGETRVGLSRNPAEHHSALEWSPSNLHGRVLSRPVEKGMFQSTARRHHQWTHALTLKR